MRKEKQAVIELIKKYKTTNIYELCDCLNIDVSFSNIGQLRGFYRYLKRNYFIVINKNLSEKRREFVCAHELGHLILHKDENRILMDTNIHIPNRLENEANRFAIYLVFENLEKWQLRDYTNNELSRITGIPLKYLNELNF